MAILGSKIRYEMSLFVQFWNGSRSKLILFSNMVMQIEHWMIYSVYKNDVSYIFPYCTRSVSAGSFRYILMKRRQFAE